jgi:ATP-binding cassette subfamily C protein
MNVIEQLGYFLTQRDKLHAAGLLFLTLLGAGFEALGVALIFPFITLVSGPDAVEHYAPLRWLYQRSGLSSPQQFLIWCGAGLLIMYLAKALYLSVLFYFQYRFIFNRQVALSRRLLSAYLHSPYTFHLQRNSAELLRNVNSEVLWIFSGVLVPVSHILIESLVILMILAILVSVEPLSAVGAIGLLGVAGAVFYRVIRRRVSVLGAYQQQHNASMIKWVNQGLGGVKEAKVLGREEFFLDAYTKSSEAYACAMRFLRTVNEMPRLAIEGLTIGGLLFVVLLMLINGENMQLVLPTLGLFAMAAMRLMPSVNRIASGVTLIRYYTPSIQVVYEDLRALEQNVWAGTRLSSATASKHAEQALPFTRAIELRRVRYQYPEAERPAVDEVSLTILKGQSVAFVGPSGAGKTTIVDVILGLLTPTEGQVLVDGVDILHRVPAWQHQIGYIPQRIYLCDDTIRRNIAFGLPDEVIDDERVWSALRAAQLEDLINSLPSHLDTLVGEHGVRLSGGQRQRIGIARALYHAPSVLVLDEAMAALDNETEYAITRAVTQFKHGKTIIMIAHRLTTVRNCDCLFFMKNGRVVASAPYGELFEINQDFRNMVRAATASHEVLV